MTSRGVMYGDAVAANQHADNLTFAPSSPLSVPIVEIASFATGVALLKVIARLRDEEKYGILGLRFGPEVSGMRRELPDGRVGIKEPIHVE
jgi:hypothetical protein